MPDEVLCETVEAVGVVRINRPETLNALNLALLDRIVAALERYDADAKIHCMLLAGGERAFSSGHDLAELAAMAPVDVYRNNSLAVFDDWSGPALYGGTGLGVVRWDGSTWQYLSTGPTGNVWTLATFDDGTGPALYAGGNFIELRDGTEVNCIAKWDGQT